MEATIRKESANQATLILDGRLDTSVTQQTEKEIADRANEIVAQGGTFIDVGAYSTRPGATEVFLLGVDSGAVNGDRIH